MATRGPNQGSRVPIPYRALAGFIVACAAFAAVFVALAVGAYHAPRPHNLPVGIVASAAATGGIEHALDTALPGNSNVGHDTYGTDALTDEQRWQLVEYLKTL